MAKVSSGSLANPDMAALVNPRAFAGAVEDEVIYQVESALGVRFPPSYREFLRAFGAGNAGEFEICGIDPNYLDSSQTPLFASVLDATTQFRRAGGIPEAYVLVSGDGGDFNFFIDTESRDPQDECPIVVLGPGRSGDQVADSFSSFIALAASGTLEF